MKIVQIVHRMEFESINTSKKHYITVHYKKIFRHGALSYRYERLLFFLILSKNKISYSRNNRKGSPYFWVFKTTSNPCSTNNGNSTCDSKRPKMAILVSSELRAFCRRGYARKTGRVPMVMALCNGIDQF